MITLYPKDPESEFRRGSGKLECSKDEADEKGGVPGISGCVEHTNVLNQVIREARENKGNLAMLWLTLANTYGSIPHKLVELTLQRYHVPERFQKMLQGYVDNIKVSTTSR